MRESPCIAHANVGFAAVLFCFAIANETVAFAEDEVSIGHNAAGRLVGLLDSPQPLTMEDSVFPGFEGYATGLVGFHGDEFLHDGEDFFPLDHDSNIQGILISADYGIHVFNGPNPMMPGDSMDFGPPDFDYHPLFHIYDGVPGESYTLRFVFHDISGLYPDSEVFSLSFTPEATCPADFNLDGGIDGGDVSAFFSAWESGASNADVNHDGGIDGSDVAVFFAAWENAGC